MSRKGENKIIFYNLGQSGPQYILKMWNFSRSIEYKSSGDARTHRARWRILLELNKVQRHRVRPVREEMQTQTLAFCHFFSQNPLPWKLFICRMFAQDTFVVPPACCCRDCAALRWPLLPTRANINCNPKAFVRGRGSADEGQRHRSRLHVCSETSNVPHRKTHISITVCLCAAFCPYS